MTIGGSSAAVELAALRPWQAWAPAITPAERRGRIDRPFG